MAASAHGTGDQAIQPATDLVAAGLIASGIALRLAQINWFFSRPDDKVNNPLAAPTGGSERVLLACGASCREAFAYASLRNSPRPAGMPWNDS